MNIVFHIKSAKIQFFFELNGGFLSRYNTAAERIFRI